MSKLRVNAFSVSADGFGAGPDQGLDHPLGRGGEQPSAVRSVADEFRRLAEKELRASEQIVRQG